MRNVVIEMMATVEGRSVSVRLGVGVNAEVGVREGTSSG